MHLSGEGYGYGPDPNSGVPFWTSITRSDGGDGDGDPCWRGDRFYAVKHRAEYEVYEDFDAAYA